MKKQGEKLWIFILIIFIIIMLYFTLKVLIINIINKDAIEKNVAKNYPEYEIIDKNYMYLDYFWSTWYHTKDDNLFFDIKCNATLRNKYTGMCVAIPFYHSNCGLYKDNRYGCKNIKQLVKDYEKFWNKVNDLSRKNNVEIHLSNVQLTEANNCDITELTIYIKEEKSKDSQEIMDSIEKIDTNLIFLSDIQYIVAKEKAFKDFSPWNQANIYEITLGNRKIESTKDELNYDFFRAYKSEIKWYKEYYIFD